MGLFPFGGGFTIDGVGSDTWRMYYKTWSISVVPGLRASLVAVPGRTGKKSAGVEIDSRIVRLSLSCFNPSRAGLMANLRAFSAAVDPRVGAHKLILTDDDPNYFIWVVPNSEVPASPELVKADFEVQFEAADPHWYYTTPRSYSWTANNTTTKVVDNINGNASTPVKFHVTGPTTGTATGIKISYAGSSFTYNGTLVSGDTLDVDTDAYTVLKNGVNDIANWGGDDFPLLPPGAAQTMTWHDTNNAGATVTISYNERSI